MKLARYSLQMMILLPLLFGITFMLVSLTGNDEATAQTSREPDIWVDPDGFVREKAGEPPRRINEQAADARAPRRLSAPGTQAAANKAAPTASAAAFRPTTVR